MDETIYAIPINDAFDETETCPLCRLKAAYEEDLLRYYLGPALMEPSIRIQTNTKGFCHTHFHRMHRSGINRLGLALILQTHIEDKKKIISKYLDNLSRQKEKKSCLAFSKVRKDDMQTVVFNESSCMFCTSLSERMQHYYQSVVYLHENDVEFKAKLKRAKTLCVPHAVELITESGLILKADTRKHFAKEINEIIEQQINTIQSDLQWYVDKHDYRNHDAPWGDSKEAAHRAITLLLGEESQ